jgi:hypothetical protein
MTAETKQRVLRFIGHKWLHVFLMSCLGAWALCRLFTD